MQKAINYKKLNSYNFEIRVIINTRESYYNIENVKIDGRFLFDLVPRDNDWFFDEDKRKINRAIIDRYEQRLAELREDDSLYTYSRKNIARYGTKEKLLRRLFLLRRCLTINKKKFWDEMCEITPESAKAYLIKMQDNRAEELRVKYLAMKIQIEADNLNREI